MSQGTVILPSPRCNLCGFLTRSDIRHRGVEGGVFLFLVLIYQRQYSLHKTGLVLFNSNTRSCYGCSNSEQTLGENPISCALMLLDGFWSELERNGHGPALEYGSIR